MRPTRPWLALLVHLVRVGVFVAVVLLIRQQQRQRANTGELLNGGTATLAVARLAFPTASQLTAPDTDVTRVLDAAGVELGTLVLTSPAADRIIGFSGPTNTLIAFDPQGKIAAVRIVSSRDTREHVSQVEGDSRFLKSYVGLTRDEAASRSDVDAVTGATLTSLAIAESITARLGGRTVSLRFPELDAPAVQPLYPTAVRVEWDTELPGLHHVYDASGAELGLVLRSSPAADSIVGYQGPTDVLIGLQPVRSRDHEPTTGAAGEGMPARALTDAVVTGIVVGRSYDNEPYVTYVREDRYFFKTFVGRTLSELAQLDLQAARVEGVSGATMTSMAVAQGLPVVAAQIIADAEKIAAWKESQRLRLSARDWGTSLVALLGVVLGLSRWRARTWVRWPWLIVLVGYLGFVNADLVSQAQLAGWAINGVPWRKVFGLTVLTAAALTMPIITRSNVYCSHLCPHGAAQQLLMRRLRWQIRLGPRVHQSLQLIPGLLLAWVVVVAMTGWGFSLVDIEPFDAYVPWIAGIPALVLFGGGLVASLFVPMAYCQYGCPTGALLGWLRRNPRGDRFSNADAIALLCLALAWSLPSLERWTGPLQSAASAGQQALQPIPSGPPGRGVRPAGPPTGSSVP